MNKVQEENSDIYHSDYECRHRRERFVSVVNSFL
jgi:hypothetical protein